MDSPGELVPDWPFEDPPNTAAITTRLVLDDGAPILLVTHGMEDGGWRQSPRARRPSGRLASLACGRGGPVAARSGVDPARRAT